jgi:hypothetical protein
LSPSSPGFPCSDSFPKLEVAGSTRAARSISSFSDAAFVDFEITSDEFRSDWTQRQRDDKEDPLWYALGMEV